MDKTSRIPGFYRLSVEERINKVAAYANLTTEETSLLQSLDGLPMETADRMIENVIGAMQVPMGIATNFLINDHDFLIPMAVEETSVVAAASNGAKRARDKGGFTARAAEPIMIGQIQILHPSPDAEEAIRARASEILDLANEQDKILVKLGGGAKDIQVRRLSDDMLAVHLLVDVRDAMGANAVNTMAEACAPLVADISSGEARLRIISNLADRRLVEAVAVFDKKAVGGTEIVDHMLDAYRFASLDPYRAVTHNKGIMNGIDAVVLATGNDWRAVEAGAHAFAAVDGYGPLSHWEKTPDGHLQGTLRMPLALGIVGGTTKVHRMAQIALKILGVQSAGELAEIVASVGLAQNFAAMHALATKGIQKGHMSLHAKNIAVMVGAVDKEIEQIAERLIEENAIRVDRAEEILGELRT